MAADKASELYFGGLPTDPEVRRLREAFPDVLALRGTTIEHSQIEAIIGEKRTTNRYRSITTAWRRRVRKETGVEIRGDMPEIVGVGFRILSDGEQVTFSIDLRQRGARKIRHSHVALANVDSAKLTEEERRVRDHGLHAAKMIHTAIVESRKYLPEAPKPPQKN